MMVVFHRHDEIVEEKDENLYKDDYHKKDINFHKDVSHNKDAIVHHLV